MKKREELLELVDENDETHVVEFKSRYSEESIAVERKGHLYRLTTSNCIEKQVDLWAKNYENENPYSVFVIFGMANGAYLRKLNNMYPEAAFVIYDPSVNVVKKFVEDKDNIKIINQDNVFIGAGKKGKRYVYTMMEVLLSAMSFKTAKWIILPGYYNLYPQQIVEVYKKYLYFMKYVIFNNNTKLVMEKTVPQNILMCVQDMKSQYLFTDLRNAVSEKINEDSVAILVSAGPSLDINIEQLKMAQNKAFILAADTALRTLSKNNIVPDMTITIDPKKPVSFFETEEFENIPIILETSGNYKIFDKHRGKRFYLCTGDEFTQNIFKKVSKPLTSLITGGSVSNTAFSALVAMGFKKIILIGQDLAFTNGKLHSDGVHIDKQENIPKRHKNMYEVEGLDGNPILTQGDYDTYRKWFELQLENNDNITVVNASAKGARIHGAEEREFSDIFKEWNKSQKRINYKDIVAGIKPMCDDTEIQVVEDYLLKLPAKLKRYRRRIKKSVELYKRLDKLKKENKSNTEEFSNIFHEIKNTNKWLNNIDELSIISMYEPNMEVEICSRIYDVQENEEDEWNANVYLGINTMNFYIKGIDGFLKDYNKFFSI